MNPGISHHHHHHHHHHYHHLLLSPLGTKGVNKRRHLILFLASFLTKRQLFPSSSASLWTDLLQVCLGLPPFRGNFTTQTKSLYWLSDCQLVKQRSEIESGNNRLSIEYCNRRNVNIATGYM
jgi:hypothetical protein